jgi:hypothetical protein
VTVHDTLQLKDQLPLVHEEGCRALWLGVEDLTAKLVKKGQGADRTTEAFRALRDVGIGPMPMMMHHDTQPLVSRGSNYGLLNQVELLRKAGAVSMQILMLPPRRAPGCSSPRTRADRSSGTSAAGWRARTTATETTSRIGPGNGS